MDPGFLYALGTLLIWLAIGTAAGCGIQLLRGLLLGVGDDPASHWRRIGFMALLSGVGFLAASVFLPPAKGKGVQLPLVWVVMPFLAWLGLISIGFVLFRILQALSALNPEDRGARFRAAGIWGIVGLAAIWRRADSGDSIEVLKGSIPLSFSTLSAVLLLALALTAVMLWAGKSARARGYAKSTANHLALGAGSVVFGLPFAWLLITSFKEDRDMASPDGLVWIPRVQKTVPYFDPEEPIVEGLFEGEPAEGPILERYPDGSAKIEINKPAVLRGQTFVVKPPLKIVPKQINVVRAQWEGQSVTGKVVKNLADGRSRVEVMEPTTLKGRTFEAKPDQLELVRPVGLKYLNYPEALDYLPRETNRGLVYLRNTVTLVILNVLGTLLSSSIVAYAFARLRFPGKNALFLLLLSTMMLPAAVTLIPQFLIFRWLGWIDTLKPLWVPAFLGSAFNIFLLRQFFMSVPMELEDAAKIDGCSYLKTFWRVMLPQVKPALAVVAIWTFMGSWTNFLQPLIYINSPENMPISYALQLFQGDRVAEPGLLMAFATLSMLPVLLVFFFAQKYFIEGVTLSGLGGR